MSSHEEKYKVLNSLLDEIDTAILLLRDEGGAYAACASRLEEKAAALEVQLKA
jgi:hypothetical protein